MRLNPNQGPRMAQHMFLNKLDAALARQVPEFAAWPAGERLSLVVASLEAAEALRLRTEQGLAAYALAACFLGLGFEAGSASLRSMLASPLPEVRRVHALNEWVSATLGDPSNPGHADAALRQSLQRTAAWGGGAADVAKEGAHGLG